MPRDKEDKAFSKIADRRGWPLAGFLVALLAVAWPPASAEPAPTDAAPALSRAKPTPAHHRPRHPAAKAHPAAAKAQKPARPDEYVVISRASTLPTIRSIDLFALDPAKMGQDTEPGEDGGLPRQSKIRQALEGGLPEEWAGQVEALRALPLQARLRDINRMVNAVRYVDDGDPVTWHSPARFFAKGGVCREYVVAKAALLAATGVPHADLRLITVAPARPGAPFHVVLAVRDRALGEDFLLDIPTRAGASEVVKPVREALNGRRAVVWIGNQEGGSYLGARPLSLEGAEIVAVPPPKTLVEEVSGTAAALVVKSNPTVRVVALHDEDPRTNAPRRRLARVESDGAAYPVVSILPKAEQADGASLDARLRAERLVRAADPVLLAAADVFPEPKAEIRPNARVAPRKAKTALASAQGGRRPLSARERRRIIQEASEDLLRQHGESGRER